MKSNPHHTNESADDIAYEYPVDSCNHQISTSLRDLSSQYKNLKKNKSESGKPE